MLHLPFDVWSQVVADRGDAEGRIELLDEVGLWDRSPAPHAYPEPDPTACSCGAALAGAMGWADHNRGCPLNAPELGSTAIEVEYARAGGHAIYGIDRSTGLVSIWAD